MHNFSHPPLRKLGVTIENMGQQTKEAGEDGQGRRERESTA
jgi:hypothetical protein